jgi:hypothetical protein
MEYNPETFLAIVRRNLLFKQRTSSIPDFHSKGKLTQKVLYVFVETPAKDDVGLSRYSRNI